MAVDPEAAAVDPVARFLGMLEIEQIGDDRFQAWNPAHPTGRERHPLFGGQVAAHALRAAAATVDVPHHPHSLHGYFLRPGRDDAPTILHVERLRDGKSFTTRSVVARQGEEAIFSLTASFHKDEPGGEFATPIAPDVPGPDELREQVAPSTWPWGGDGPFERIEVPAYSHARRSTVPRRAMWIRVKAPIGDDVALHACVLTYVSDMGTLGAVRAALGRINDRTMGASLDHALWFHRRVRMDEWLLFDVSSRSNAGARGLGIGTMHTAAGVHVATIGQEGLVRILS